MESQRDDGDEEDKASEFKPIASSDDKGRVSGIRGVSQISSSNNVDSENSELISPENKSFTYGMDKPFDDTLDTNDEDAKLTGNITKVFDEDLFSEPRSHMNLDDDDIMNITLGSGNLQLNSLTLPRRQYTKLEVVQAYEIESLLRTHHIFVGLGILYSLLIVILMNTVYASSTTFPGWDYQIRIFRIPKGLNWFQQVSCIPLFCYTLFIFGLFTHRIFQLKVRARTKEQIWIIFLLFTMLLYLNPFRAIVKINDVLLFTGHANDTKWSNENWCKLSLKISEILEITGFNLSTVFYVWATIHSYRLLNEKLTYMFYVPKLLVLGIYIVSKIVIQVSYNVTPSEMFTQSFISMLSTYSTAQRWPRPGLYYACISFVFELIVSLKILLEYRKTRKVLQNSDYLKYRTQQIGFRFFVYHNLTFYLIYGLLYMLMSLAIPNGFLVFILRSQNQSIFKLPDFEFGIRLMLVAYVSVEAYVNLPADSKGFLNSCTIINFFAALFAQPRCNRQCCAGSSSSGGSEYGNRIELEPITYRKREPPSLNGIISDLRANCFVMQTHVTLFNFAWLVYYWNTPKVESIKLTQDVFPFVVADYIADKETDTHVLIIDGSDRIIIAFKGTTSTKNLKTDINMFYSSASSLLPSKDPDGAEDEDDERDAMKSELLKTYSWKRAKIHKGFAVAYAAISIKLIRVLKVLQAKKRRPVFLTGHSLGGALATVCSLDIYFRLPMNKKEIFVSTFGAPRVGNRHFQLIYNQSIPIHWRIVVGPDVVAKLPKMGYKHVGKKVLITVDGDLFIDPNSLELNLWSGDVASILYHRKASYLLAMRAWCERHHGDEYVPEFWPFPVSKDDTKRFQHAMVRSGYTASVRSSTPKRERILELDAMVEALNTDCSTLNQNAVVNWKVLTERLLMGDATQEKDTQEEVELDHPSRVQIYSAHESIIKDDYDNGISVGGGEDGKI